MTTDDLRQAQALLAALRAHTHAELATTAVRLAQALHGLLPPAQVEDAAHLAAPAPGTAPDSPADTPSDTAPGAVRRAAASDPGSTARGAPAGHPLSALQALADEAAPTWRARGLDPAAASRVLGLTLRLAALPASHEAGAALCRAVHPAGAPWATPALVLRLHDEEAPSSGTPVAAAGLAADAGAVTAAAGAPALASTEASQAARDALHTLLCDPPPALRGLFRLDGEGAAPGADLPWHARSLRLHAGIVAALHAQAPPPPCGRLLAGAEVPGLDGWLAEPATAQAVQALAQGRPCRILLLGGTAAMRATRVQALLGAAQAVALCVQAGGDGLPTTPGNPPARGSAQSQDEADVADRLAAARQIARLHQAALWLAGDDEDAASAAPSGTAGSADAATLPWSVPVLQSAARESGVLALPLPLLRLNVAPLTPASRRALWQGLLPQLGAAAGSLAARYAIEPEDARDVVRDLSLRQALTGAPLALDDVAARIRERTPWQARPGLKRVQPRAGFAQLHVPAPVKAQLQAAVQRVAQQLTVLDDWGFAPGPGGRRGLRLLFCGPPGTGKSLAAEAMAQALGVHLLVVDLASLVSKWIGETEKNLAAVFDVAERARALLLFDEADALFGRRSEGHDAHDRHANLETAYLLQRLEDFEGVAVLTTNLRGHLDSAFTRRFEFIVEFPEPDAAARLALWRLHLPPQAPLAADVDLAQLADWYALTGAQIRNAALAAAFAAAAEGGVPAQRHLLRAIEREHDKAGRAHPGFPPGALPPAPHR